MAEREGFEPSKPCGLQVFETCCFNHSHTSPKAVYLCIIAKINLSQNKSPSFKGALKRIVLFFQGFGQAVLLLQKFNGLRFKPLHIFMSAGLAQITAGIGGGKVG